MERGNEDAPTVEEPLLSSHIKRFVKSMQKMTEKNERDFLHGLLREERTPMMARARIEHNRFFNPYQKPTI